MEYTILAKEINAFMPFIYAEVADTFYLLLSRRDKL